MILLAWRQQTLFSIQEFQKVTSRFSMFGKNGNETHSKLLAEKRFRWMVMTSGVLSNSRLLSASV